MMDFRQAESKFKQLKAQFEAGELTETEFKNRLEELMVQDEAGSWWMIGFETEQWYRHDGSDWVQADRPESLSGQSPAEGETAERATREKAGRKPSVDESTQALGKVEPRKAETRETSRAFSAPTIFRFGYAGIAGIVGAIGLIIIIILFWPDPSPVTPEPPVVPTKPTFTSTATSTFTPTPTSTFTPTPTPFPIEISDVDPGGNAIAMRLVPAGEFTMGEDADDAFAECQKYLSDCERDWFTDEEPPHQVYLDAFYMDTYEVTNASYQACVGTGECSQPVNTGHYDNPDYVNHPVVYVDWNQAKIYCKWRGGDLPTEAQWEKAARGTDGRIYPWGEGIDCNRANYGVCGVGDTTEVGSYESGASPYGLYDMAGNVWEWVADWYNSGYYAALEVDVRDPTGPRLGNYRVLRGGSWSSMIDNLRVSDRLWVNPNDGNDNFGFRCVLGTFP